eukprot:Em0024g208a
MTSERPLVFHITTVRNIALSNPPHLKKSVRNCWSNPKRRLLCNGMPISWDHLKELYTKNRAQADDTGLALKFEHIHLTSYSKMRVDLAAQVLSNSVAKELLCLLAKRHRIYFAEIFDRFFDCLNSSSLSAGKRSRNPFRSPYRSGTDWKLKWLTDVFLPYLDEWENCVYEREGFDKSQRSMMLLSKETRQSLKVTVMSFVELVQYLSFTIPGVTVFLGNRICQDPLENFFGQQRQRGRANGNPSSSEFIHNTQALRIVSNTFPSMSSQIQILKLSHIAVSFLAVQLSNFLF